LIPQLYSCKFDTAVRNKEDLDLNVTLLYFIRSLTFVITVGIDTCTYTALTNVLSY